MYLNKDGHEVMYLGRLPFYYSSQKWVYNNTRDSNRWGGSGYGGNYVTTQHNSKKHIFISLDKEINAYAPGVWTGETMYYWVQPGFTKLAERLTEDPSPQYAAEFDRFKASRHGKDRPVRKKVKK